MKRTASLITISTSVLFLAAAMSAFASTDVDVSNNGEGSHTNVNVETNTGGNTICQNGKCTTTSNSNGTSKVCVNGVCHNSEDGNVNYQSDDGNTKVNIKSNTGDSSVSVQNKAGGEEGVELPTVSPNVEKDVKGAADNNVAKAKADAEKRLHEAEAKKFDFLAFIKAELDSVKKFFTLGFLFGKHE